MKSTKKGSALFLLSVLTMGSFGLTAEASAQLAKPSKPQGTTDEWKTDAPEEEQALSAVEHGGNAGDDQLKNIARTNPFIHILDGFDQVWSMNQPAWRDGTALTEPGENGEVADYGDGPTVYYDGYKNDPTKVVADQKTFVNTEIRDLDYVGSEYSICRASNK